MQIRKMGECYLIRAAIEQNVFKGTLCIPALFTNSEPDMRLPKRTVRFKMIEEKQMLWSSASCSEALCIVSGFNAS